jgi:hypothetical protein
MKNEEAAGIRNRRKQRKKENREDEKEMKN